MGNQQLNNKEESMYQIYKITCPTGETYYGQHRGDIFDDDYWGSGVRITNYYNKHTEYSESDYIREVLYSVETQEECNELEIQVIFNGRITDKDCMNIADGGDNTAKINDYIWITNDIEESLIYYEDTIPEGYHTGRLPGSCGGYNTDKVLYNNGIIEKYFSEDPGNGWVIGRLNEYQWYTNGIEERKLIIGTQPDNWKEGRLPNANGNLGSHWYNNGVEQTWCIDGQEPEGWVKGKLITCNMDFSSGKKWYNNGHEQRMYYPNEQPDGWSLGMLKRSR